jgi:YVTN family beta-propeller protein
MARLGNPVSHHGKDLLAVAVIFLITLSGLSLGGALRVSPSGGTLVGGGSVNSGGDLGTVAGLGPRALAPSLPSVLTSELGRPPPARPSVSGTPYVAYTLDLLNNTLIPGNFSTSNGLGPIASAYDSGKGEVFVADLNTDNVSVISDTTNLVVATVAVGGAPAGVAYDSAKGEVFVTNANSNNTVVASIAVGLYPQGVAYDTGRGEVFVADNNADNVSVISDATNTVVATVPVGSYPQGLAYDSGRGEVFVTNANSDNVSVVSDATNTVVANIPLGASPQGAAYDGAKSEVFVADNGANNVSVISDASNAVVATVAVGSYPEGLAYDSGRGEVFVTNFNSNNLSVILDTNNTVFASVPVGSVPYGVAYDSGNAYLYVDNFYGGSVSIVSDGGPARYAVTFSETGLPSGTNWSATLNGSTLTSTTTTIVFSETNGTYPFAVGLVPGFSSLPSSGRLTVSGGSVGQPIAFTVTKYAVMFAESGLAVATNWSVTLNGSTASSTTATIAFNEANGTYSFTVGPLPGYTTAPSAGNVTVNGSSVRQPIAFTVVTYGVTFAESGLPAGTSWTVSLNGTPLTTSTSLVAFTEPNGSYSFTVTPVASYAASPRSGTVTVAGGPVTQPITFTSTRTGPYPVTFSETGLLSGRTWSVLMNGSSQSSTTSPIVFMEPNGTYSFTLGLVPGYTAAPSSGNVTVAGSPVSQPIAFAVTTYTVTFAETGLASGTSWTVTLGGAQHNSTTSSVTFTEPNGTYAFVVGPVASYSASPRSGMVGVSAAPFNQPISFVSTVTGPYAVTFTETGLPAGTDWTVTLGGTPRSSTTTAVVFSEPNGSYAFSVTAPVGFGVSPSAGNVAVRGAPVNTSVVFLQVFEGYAVTFAETGLPQGTNWSVTLGTTTHTSNGSGTVALQLGNGTYNYQVGSVVGYQVSPSSGSITVAGQDVNVSVTFTNTTTSSPGSGGLSTLEWVIIGAVVALAVALLVVFLLRRRSRGGRT